MSSQHPLDRDPDDDGDVGFDFSSPQSGQTASPDRTLLKLSVRAIVVLGVLVFLSSVAVNNLNYGSSEFQVAYIISRVLMGLLLLSFIGVLLAYRVPKIRQQLSQLGPRPFPGQRVSGPSQGASIPGQLRFAANHAELGASFVAMNSSDGGSTRLGTATSPMVWLIAFSLTAIILAWIAALLVDAQFRFAIFLTSTATTLLPGLLIVMIVWHRGCVRAYAIGALASYLVSFMVLSQQAFMLTQFAVATNPPGMYPGPNWSSAYSIGISWTTIVASGLIPATYVWLLEKISLTTTTATQTRLNQDGSGQS